MSATAAAAVKVPSPQQAGVYEFVKSGRGSANVVAVAGAGKTTTLVNAVMMMQGNVTFFAFNKKIVEEISARLQGKVDPRRVRATTVHAAGYGAYRYANKKVGKPDERKIGKILESSQVPEFLHGFVAKLVSFARQQGMGIKGLAYHDSMWREQVERNDLDQMLSNGGREDAAAIDQLVDDGIAWAKTVLKASIKQAREDGIIDFDDMLYMPLLDNVRFFQIDWALVDEAQDTNPVRRELIRRMLKPTGRLIAVGDPRQAIYGFTGADAESMDIIAQTFKCVTLPLTVTFRCPKAVVRVAQQWVSHIQAAETAPEGIYREISQDDFNALPAGEFRVDDAILCRNTAPLVKLAMSLIRKKVACHVEGRDIAAGLVKLARRWKVKTLAALSDRLDTYLKNEMEKALAKKQEMKAQQIEDTVETLRVFISDLKPGDSIDTLVSVIESLFGDTEADKRPDSLTLSTIHKSKGREWARVFWYGRAKWQPSKYARQEWQQVQEDNLCYVAATRSMHELVEVHVS